MRQTIGIKIGAVLGIALLALGVVGGLFNWATSQLIGDAGRVAQALEVNKEIEGLLASLHESESLQRGHLLTGSDRYLDDYKKAAKGVTAHLARLQSLIEDPGQKRRLEAILPLISERLDRFEEGSKIRIEKGLEGAAEYVNTGVGQNLMSQIWSGASALSEGENALLAARQKQSRTSTGIALNSIRCGIPIAVAAVITIGLLLAQNITRPLKAATSIAERLAIGDVSVDIPPNDRGDEIGLLLSAFQRMAGFQREMASVAERVAAGDLRAKVSALSDKDVLGKAFAGMVTNLQRLTIDIAEAVDVLGSAANEIVASTTQFAAAATETVTAMSETTTTVEEVRQAAQLSSQKARAVSESAKKTAQVSEAGRKSTEQTVEGMNRIWRQMESLATSMVRLSEQTQAISQIIATVDDLAAQSNLLAVNAAIEAAKAGEQGKGFAVVAQEVKSLAEQSKQATNQVRTILSDIQKATSAAVMAAEQGGKAVESGVKQSTQAGESIMALSNSVTEAAQAAIQIAASNQQQLIGVEQVASAMESIRQSSVQNEASARQLETSARNLNDLGQKLKDLTETYRV